MTQEITINGEVFEACEDCATREYVVFLRKFPLEEQVAKRRKMVKKGKIPVILERCPMCAEVKGFETLNSERPPNDRSFGDFVSHQPLSASDFKTKGRMLGIRKSDE